MLGDRKGIDVSKPFFITCRVKEIIYLRGKKVVNNPVNLALCKTIEKTKYSWYPDNEGRCAIRFNGCDQEWVFDSKEDRDSEFSRLQNNKFNA